ncbi:MAG TPA: hypothetical protein V6C89_20730 [Drouetiella sp.]|jgi:hypothetical protein
MRAVIYQRFVCSFCATFVISAAQSNLLAARAKIPTTGDSVAFTRGPDANNQTSGEARCDIRKALQSPGEQANLIACATCGCSELCSVSLIDENLNAKGGSTLSDSIWGNIILKIAYDRDAELKNYRKKLRLTDNVTSGALFGVAGGTLAQTITSTATLNPPDGMPDSYVPGIIGLSLDVAANLTFGSRALLDHNLKKRMRARQLTVKARVEKILVHLENSETKCPEAQSDLSTIIGDRAAAECIQLWQSSHELAQAEPRKLTEGLKSH